MSELLRLSCRAMGSQLELYLSAPQRDDRELEQVGEQALALALELESELSHYREESQICRLNREAALKPVSIDPWLFELLIRCRQLTQQSRGAFDPTRGALIRRWGLYRAGQTVGELDTAPNSKELRRLQEAGGWDKVQLDADTFTVQFTHPELELNLGACGKGYIVQRLADWLRLEKVETALISSGQSSIAALGNPPEMSGWPLELEGKNHESAGIIYLPDGLSLSTSSGEEAGMIVSGVRRSHLLDPRTGELLIDPPSVSVATPDALMGDALSTAFTILNSRETDEICSLFDHTGAIITRSLSGVGGCRETGILPERQLLAVKKEE